MHRPMNLEFGIISYSCIKITKLIAVVSFSRVGLNMLLLAFLFLVAQIMRIIIWTITFEVAWPVLP